MLDESSAYGEIMGLNGKLKEHRVNDKIIVIL